MGEGPASGTSRDASKGMPRDNEVNMPKSILRWATVLALGLALSAAALFLKEFVAFARTTAPLSRAYNSWFGLLFHGTQALVYTVLGGVMVLVADQLIKEPGLSRQRSQYEEQPYR
jgi:hypothetical protein